MKRNGRCVCGLRIAHHFNKRNAKLSCADARQLHPRARTTRADIFAQLLRMGVR
jgi:hypothetical protein